MMVLVADSDARLDSVVADDLHAAGVQAQTVPESALLLTLAAIANSGGRVDALFLSGHIATVLPLARRVRDLDDVLVFRGGVRANTTPIVLRAMTSLGRLPPDFEPELAVSGDDFPKWTVLANHDRDRESAVIEAIQLWRDSLIMELDYVGFAVSVDATGRVQVSHALQRKRREGEILAPTGTPGSLRENQYLILADDVLDQLSMYTELKYLLENYEAIAEGENIKPETVFQRFFQKNPHLVKRNLFEQVWAKPLLRRSEAPGRSFAPDFVLKPIVGAHLGTNWEILDLKLPDDVLITSGGFHRTYSHKLVRAMQQLRNYRNYFSRQDEVTRNELIARFGYQPVHPRIAVLMGRRHHEKGLDRIQGDSSDLDIDVITYDDIVEFEENRLVLHGTIAGLFTA